MAIINVNPKLCLLLLTLSLILSPSLSYKRSQRQQEEEDESSVGELFECFLRCDKRRGNDDTYDFTKCEQKCVDHYQDIKGEEDSSSSYAQTTEEPRKVYDRCISRCDKQRGSKSQEYQCIRTCDEMMKKRRQQQGDCGCGRGTRCHCGGAENDHQPPEEQYKECRSRCGRQWQGQRQGEQRQYCEKRCQWELEKHGERGGHVAKNNIAGKEEHEQKRGSGNPYFFEKQSSFDTEFRTEQGNIKVLQRFSKRSELLQGIDNYRLAILEANPNTFVLPHHSDAEAIFFLVGGKGTISYVWENERRSYNLKEGDVMRVPAGAIVYLINRDDNEKLYILKLLQPVNTPGKFKDYFGAGGENPESFYTTFSNDILEAAFNTPREKLDKLFQQQKSKGVIIRASKEQIKALSEESRTSSKGKTEERWNPINLLNKTPLFSNKFGQYFEASPNDHDQLKDLDVAVGFMNIKKGGMVAPFYNSRSTKLALVVGGSGYVEMACPHLSKQSKHGYAKVRGRLSVGDAFVVPAGHPVAVVASGDSDLKLASFGINGGFNQKYLLAGKKNIWEAVEKEAIALTFGVPAAEVEEILKRQEESYFVAGPKQQGKSRHVASILEFAGF